MRLGVRIGLNHRRAVALPPVTVPTVSVTSSSPTQIAYTFTPDAGVTYTASLVSSGGAVLATVASTGSGSFAVPGGTYGVKLTATRTADGSTTVGIATTQATDKGSLSTGLVESYPMGEASGTRTGINGATLAVNSGGSVGSTTGLRLPLAANFDGGAANFLAGSTTIDLTAGPVSIAFWMRSPNPSTNNKSLFGLNSPGTSPPSQIIGTVSGTGQVGLGRPGYSLLGGTDFPNAFANQTWTLVVFTAETAAQAGLSTNRFRTYVNGVNTITDLGDSSAIGAANHVLEIGSNGYRAFSLPNFIGQIQDWVVYNRLLTPSEIRALFIVGPLTPPYNTVPVYPSAATRRSQTSFLFANRTAVVHLPAASIGVSPPVNPDWTNSALLKTIGTLSVPESKLMFTDKSRAIQATAEVAVPNTTGTLMLTDGSLVCTTPVYDPTAVWNTTDAAALKAYVQSTITTCNYAGETNLPYGSIVPGASYASGQWSWDSAWAVGLASKMGSANITLAKGWAKSWAAHITAPGDSAGRDGATPLRVGRSNGTSPGVEDTGPQQWLWGWAVNRVYLVDSDLAFVTAMYPWLKDATVYFDTVDADSSGLYSISATASSPADQVNNISNRRGDLDGTYNDYKWSSLSTYAGDSSTHTVRTSFIDVERSALLCRNAEEMRQLALALSNSTDAAAWAAKRDAIKTAVQKYCWDEVQQRFQSIERAELARSAGNVAAATGGATSITLTSPTAIWIPCGCKLILPGGVVCQPSATVELPAGVATSVPLASGLTASVSAGAATYRPFAGSTNLGMQAAPLFANAATSPQATAVRNYLYQSFDGATAIPFDVWLGSSLRGGQCMQYTGPEWQPLAQSGTTLNATSLTIPAGTQGVRIGYRMTDFANFVYTIPFPNTHPFYPERQFWHPEWERVDSDRPLTVQVSWVRNGSIAPVVKLFDVDLNAIGTVNLVAPAGADGTTVTATATFTTSCLPGVVEVWGPAGGAVAVKNVRLTTMPKGWYYYCPFGGFTSTPRLSRVSCSKPLDRTLESQARSFEQIDYWRGDCWPPQNYWAVIGLSNYTLAEATSAASEYARQCLIESQAWEVAKGASQGVFERNSSKGYSTGSPNYVWGGLPYMAGLELGVIPAT